MFVPRMFAALVVLVLVGTGASANGLPEELKARRERLMQSLGTDTIAVLWSAPERNYSRSVDYEYRQDSDLLYLTGVTQPETILVLMPGTARSARSCSSSRQTHAGSTGRGTC